jgi:hypothetical protein
MLSIVASAVQVSQRFDYCSTLDLQQNMCMFSVDIAYVCLSP